MKATILTWTTGAAILTALTIPAPVRAQKAQEHQTEPFAHYKVVDLGTLGGAYSLGLGINNAGIVAGGAATPAQQNGDPTLTNPQPPQTGFLWRRGHIINLGTLGTPDEGLNSSAGGPNASGEAALIAETAMLDPAGEDFCYFGTHRQCLAAIWKHGKLHALTQTLGGNNSQALGLNDSGQVVGFAENTDYDASCASATPFQVYHFEAVIWEPNGAIRPLAPLPGDTVGFGFGINNKGQAVGASGLCSNTEYPENPNAPHAVLWEKDGTPVDLGNLGGKLSAASSINNRGDVDGASSNENGVLHAFLWTKERGRMRDLGTLHPDDILSVATCCNTVNNSRQVVGFVLDANFNSHAFLWQHGVMVDLNTLIPKDSPWNLQSALAINEAGEITGYGIIDGNVHAFRATPRDRDDDGDE